MIFGFLVAAMISHDAEAAPVALVLCAIEQIIF